MAVYSTTYKNSTFQLNDGDIDERSPLILDGLHTYYPFDGTSSYYIPSKIRYIRDWTNGSTANSSNHWVEIKALDRNSTNVALSKLYTTSVNTLPHTGVVTDGVLGGFEDIGIGRKYVNLDLGGLYALSSITIWHYYADGRTYYSPKTEISVDGINWFTIFDGLIEGEYQETISGHTIELYNLGLTFSPESEIDTTNSYKEGLGISSPSSNLSGQLYSVWSPWNGLQGDYGQYINFYGRNGVYIDISVGGGTNYYKVNSINVSPSTKYTVSATIKIEGSVNPHPNLFYIREYYSSGVQIKEGGKFTMANNIYLGSNWYKTYATWITDAAADHITVTGYEYNAGVKLRIEDIQVEQNVNFTTYTSYIVGTRSGTSELTIPVAGSLTTYTIVGKINPRTSLYDGYNNTANQSLLFSIQDTVNPGDAQWRYYAPTVSAPFIELSGSFGSSNNHAIYDISAGFPAYFVVTKTGTSMVCKFWQDGWRPQHTASLSNDTQLNKIVLGMAPAWNVDHHGLYIYSRILSQDEMDLIVKTKEMLKSNGDLACYINEDINPNLWPNADLKLLPYDVNGNGAPLLVTDSYGTYHEMILSGSGNTYNGYDIPAELGATYVFSGWFWFSAGNTFDYAPLSIEGATSTEGATACSALPTEEWVYTQMTCVADGNVRCLIYPIAGGPGSGTIKWRGISFRKLPSDTISLNRYSELELGEFHE